MALPASGPLALTDIQTEFGGANPIGMNEYYAGGGLVPAGTSGTYGAVPSSGALSIQNFYGTSNFVPIYIEEVFSTYLYTGNSSTQTITNDIDLSTYGGLVWIKSRTGDVSHALIDTARGGSQVLSSNTDSAQANYSPQGISAFNSSGFTVNGAATTINSTIYTYASWTFRKQPKFFDVVTYTGNGSAPRNISHNLGSVPGCIMIKRTDSTGTWTVYHAGIGNTKAIFLNATATTDTNSAYWNNTTPTSTVFTLGGTFGDINANGATYVAYLFANNAGGFGLTGSDNVISCGIFSGATSVNLGYEPQWVLLKSTTAVQDWFVIDNMRGWTADGGYTFLQPNNAYGDAGGSNGPRPTSTGFYWPYPGNDYIYIAIRRGPMKVPTVGTSVYTPVALSSPATGTVTAGFPVDLDFQAIKGGNGNNTTVVDRLRGSAQLITSSTGTETNAAGVWSFASNTALIDNFGASLYWLMRRAPSFFDEVCYTGNNANSQTIYHNLGVTPEMIIVKRRSAADSWYVYTPAMPATNQIAMYLNSTMTGLIVGTGGAALWGLTSTTFEANYTAMNLNSNDTFVAYMFATCPGVSKVGSYTGTGALQTINCSFTTGSRFVLIRRIDSAGDWYVWDSARGISSGNDPYILLNTTAGETTGTNYVDTTSVGFQVTAAAPSAINANGGKFIFLAIA